MRIVGNINAGLQLEPVTPEEAWQRGRVLDAMLPNPVSVRHGVMRLTHACANAQDDGRMLQIARRLNAPQVDHGPT